MALIYNQIWYPKVSIVNNKKYDTAVSRLTSSCFEISRIIFRLFSSKSVILRELCKQKKVEIIEAQACADHIHMLISIPPSLSVAQFMGFLKGKSTLMIFDRHANLKYKYGNRHFWCRGYYVDTVGRNKKVIEEYIKNQLQEDIMEDQISLKEYMDPFTGSKDTKA